MKELKGMKIELPEGYELKQEGETYKVVKKEVKYAEYLNDIDRPYYMDTVGGISSSNSQTVNHLPTEKLAEGVLALIQLLSFRQDIWDKGGKPEGDESFGVFQYDKENISVTKFYGAYGGEIFRFKTREQAEYFKETHEDLIKEYYNKCGII